MLEDDVLIIENPELLEAFEKAPAQMKRYLADAMQDALFTIQGEIGYASYPPATEANRPGRVDQDGNPMGYYERGRGWWYPVVKNSTLGGQDAVLSAQTLGSALRRHKIAAKSVPVVGIVAGYKLAKNKNGIPGTSEVLGKSWTTWMETGEDYVTGEVGTLVSYADFVQGYNVPNFHLERGWEDMPARLERIRPQVEDRFSQALDDYIERFGESQ